MVQELCTGVLWGRRDGFAVLCLNKAVDVVDKLRFMSAALGFLYWRMWNYVPGQ